ncbi:MAG: uracil-xanthine permease family protein [Candidatus Cloacimonetes bacterium]|nr:uracil-xanthine permease family protein [Candidatus Cloacimonadota bacterium]
MKDLNGNNLVLGFQHMFVMFGATVLVPLITGLDVGVTLFAAGIGTLIFHVLTKFQVPVFLGSSFAFIPGIIAVATAKGGSLPEALGGIVIAGLLYVVVAIIFRFIDARILHKILPPFVTGPIIILIGLILAPVAISNANGTYAAGIVEKIGVNGCWGVALFTFAVAIFVKVFFEKRRRKLLSMLPVLIALISGYILAVIIGIVDFSSVYAAAWFGIPNFSLPVFSARSMSIIVPIAIVTIVEHFGDILAIGNVVGKDFIKKPGIHRTLMGDGIATSISALIGGPANTTYSENTGAVALTGNFNPVIMRIAALFAIILSFVPKFTAVIGTIPSPVIGGISVLLFGMISSIGIKNMVDHQVDFSDAKILMISAAMLVLGLGGAKFAFGNFQLEGLGLAAIVGVILNLILNFKHIISKLKD